MGEGGGEEMKLKGKLKGREERMRWKKRGDDEMGRERGEHDILKGEIMKGKGKEGMGRGR